MERTITVTGTGRASAAPDTIRLSMELSTTEKEYEKALEKQGKKSTELYAAVEKAGISKDEVKTTSFDVDTRYDSVQDKNGQYRRVFRGFEVRTLLKLDIPCDTKLLAKVIKEISSVISVPEISIRFILKDNESTKNAMLEDAAESARKKAEILCRASGVKLGDLINISYSWASLSFESRTELISRCAMEDREIGADIGDINPDDVEISDSVTFTWGIE